MHERRLENAVFCQTSETEEREIDNVGKLGKFEFGFRFI
jgi:hypothetical protein